MSISKRSIMSYLAGTYSSMKQELMAKRATMSMLGRTNWWKLFHRPMFPTGEGVCVVETPGSRLSKKVSKKKYNAEILGIYSYYK